MLSKKTIPLNLQYLGGKSRIVNKILHLLTLNKNNKKFVDLFSGSGVVAYVATTQKCFNTVYANDIQPYSYEFINALLSQNNITPDDLILTLSQVNKQDLLADSRQIFSKDYELEHNFFVSTQNIEFDWTKYKKFCDETVLLEGNQINNKNFNLFLHYYRNTYFGVYQCAEIDYLKQQISSLKNTNPPLAQALEACVISSMSYNVSSTTHLAQFLKPNSLKTTLNLIETRKCSIIKDVIDRLKDLKIKNISSNTEVFNLDYLEALENIPIDSQTVVYADPPYFKEHYSRYYHILDTFVLYDYPELTFNTRLNTVTVGRYRKDRLVSDFGKKALAPKAFEKMIDIIMTKGATLAISYASSSIVPKDFFVNYAKDKQYKLEIFEFNLQHV
ncbi:DNA adenine methylase [Acinetobacter sp. UBA1297]|uniref:DNA adenine methylase n=1 Tax=Acinetobacter sp. UBA1297 TaxID=1945925 RepID=UPI00257B4137|nr:DNA adenine methylase [Acinetobacter sp. UBA1297]